MLDALNHGAVPSR